MSASEEPVAPPPDSGFSCSESCGNCACSISCLKGEGKGSGAWKLYALVIALIFSLIAFCCNTVDAIYYTYNVITGLGVNSGAAITNTFPHGGWTNEDQVLTAGFAFVVSIFFIGIFCLDISPAFCVKLWNCMPGCCLPGGHGNWRTTFSLHAFVAGALHFAYMIMASKKQHTINKIAASVNNHLVAAGGDGAAVDTDIPALTVTAIVFAAVTSIICFLLAVAFQKDTLMAAKEGRKRTLSSISMILTFIAFVCWVHSDHHHNTIHNLWADKVFIAGSCLAALALLGGMADVCSQSADFNAMLGAILFFVFFIGAAVDIPEAGKDTLDIVTIVFAAVNGVLLFLISQDGKPGMLSRPKPELLLMVIVALSVIQFSLSAYEWPDNETGVALSDRRCILAFGFGSVCTAALFHFVFSDEITRGLHILGGAIAYMIYFVWECVESTDYFDTFKNSNALPSEAQELTFRTRTASLVFAAVICVLLLIATFWLCPRRNRRVADAEAE